MVTWLAIPGAIGGFAGATALSSVAMAAGKTWMAALLLALGVYVLLRFSARAQPVRNRELTPAGRRWLLPLGAIAGFVDATGGGGWGPVTTSTLLSTGRMIPRRTIGSVNTSELVVSLGASAGFLLTLGGGALSGVVIGGLLIGGMLAAPLAAWLVRLLPSRLLGVGAGGLIILTNTQVLLDVAGLAGPVRAVLLAVAAVTWIVALGWVVRNAIVRRRPTPEQSAETAAETAGTAAETVSEEEVLSRSR
ncbi:sulfite exporter TauE/SafE family protein [Haloactinomyces albus]|uniref:Probable membrane transporter protein n=1 Tax=Haloactinomyces albus TaxID=1352928 RepID=A0AAE3Z833_9ACTN|nr:sulfite exporter TauE/SafE family protein [Haloactinomyces albus]MDR7300066.1 putative membrane protein YfcA [Haloactinomyces albus]